MKLRYFIPSLMAVVAAVFTGCTDDNDPTYYSEIRVSQSYVSLSTSGGSTSINVEATGSWTVSGAPEWLTVSPASGTGNGTITFSAEAAEGRTAEVLISCEGKTQHINVIQGIATVSNATCAEVIAGPDSKTYRVTGAVTGIANTTYGNWYLNDGTGEVYIYGTLDKKGAEKNFLSLGIEVGDEVTVEGPKTTYNGTVELVNVTVVKINKSLIKVDSLTIAQPNAGGDRSATITLKTYSGGKEYTSQFAITQAGAIIDASVAEFLAAEVGDTQYRIQGVIQSVANASYGNVYIKDFSGETYVYGIGSKGDFEAAGLKEGDVVTLIGKRGEYKGTAQMTGAQLEAVIPVTAVTIEEFLSKPDDKGTYYMVTGKISSLLGSNGKENDYGNLYITDGTNELYVYGTYAGWGAQGDARKFFIADNGIQVGDEITIIGYKDTYKELVELCQGVCFSFKKAE